MVIRSNKVAFGNAHREGTSSPGTDTLIVWTESNGTDMALSFQEAEGCAAIWFVLALILSSCLCKFKLTNRYTGVSLARYNSI